jgi:hypothetical protein
MEKSFGNRSNQHGWLVDKKYPPGVQRLVSVPRSNLYLVRAQCFRKQGPSKIGPAELWFGKADL